MPEPARQGISAIDRHQTGFAMFRAVPASIWLSALFLILIAAAGVLAPAVAPFGIDEQNLGGRLQPPAFAGGSAAHILGTDELGRDIFSRLLHSIRISLVTALLGTVTAAVIGATIGAIAASRRGIIGSALMGLVDVQASLPFFILAIAVFAFFGNSLPILVIVVGLNGWEVHARVARGLVLAEQAKDYVEAVRLQGAGPLHIFARHLLPNIAGVLFVKMTLSFPGTILLESGLSFLGLGVQPPLTSLGLMVGTGREYLLLAPWLAIIPGLVICLTTLSVSLLGDWIRDRFDPKLRNH